MYDYILTEDEILALSLSIPETPIVTSITPNTDGFPTWTWGEVEGASAYRYSFDNTNWTYVNNDVLSFTPSTILSSGTYTLYVQAMICSNNSESGSFEVIVTSDVPEPIISVSLDINNNPIITWSSITGVTNYQIYRYTAGNSEYSVSDEANFASSATIIATTTSTSYIDTSDLEYNTVYYYAVKANAE